MPVVDVMVAIFNGELLLYITKSWWEVQSPDDLSLVAWLLLK
jgi:hypothetical protein